MTVTAFMPAMWICCIASCERNLSAYIPKPCCRTFSMRSGQPTPTSVCPIHRPPEISIFVRCSRRLTFLHDPACESGVAGKRNARSLQVPDAKHVHCVLGVCRGGLEDDLSIAKDKDVVASVRILNARQQ